MAKTLTIMPRDGLGIASVMAHKGIDAAAIGAALGAIMPIGPHVVFAGIQTIVGTGPGTWLVFADDAEPNFADVVTGQLSGLASVSDQSSSYVLYRLSGPGARTLLQRGAAIDFHPDSFGPGSAATTQIAHIGVILWQVDGQPSYDVATFRSYAQSLRHWLDLAAGVL